MDIDTISIITTGSETRGRNKSMINLEEFSSEIHSFLNKMNKILEKSPAQIGDFEFEEFEVTAEINAKGTLSLLGTGGEIGSKGGLKFIFKKKDTQGKC